MTQSELTAAIASLNVAISSGVRSATVGGQTVTYNTTASLIVARDAYQDQLNGLLGNRRPRQTYGFFAGRGYDR